MYLAQNKEPLSSQFFSLKKTFRIFLLLELQIAL